MKEGDTLKDEKAKRIKAHNLDELEKVDKPKEVQAVFKGANVERIKGKL